MPTSEQRDRRAADLRERAALVRRDGWGPYEAVWSSGEVLGVRAVLGEPGALTAAVELWAPTLWGIAAAEADARTGYQLTRRWFAALIEPEELSETERIRWKAATTAMRDALTDPDPEARAAAGAAAEQAMSRVSLAALRDKIHMPDDAAGFEDGLRAIMSRIPPNWGRWISCSRGWYPILIQLDHDLAEIDSAYELHQVKEKYSGLRYYFHASDGVSEADRQRMDTLVEAAEELCERTCDLCGADGQRHVSQHGWYRTLCGTCAEAQRYSLIGEMVNDLTPDMAGIWKVTCYADAAESYWDISRGEVTVEGTCHRDAQVLALPSVLRKWRLRLADGTEIESGLIASIERIR